MYGSRFCWRSGPVKAGVRCACSAGVAGCGGAQCSPRVVLADAEFDSEANHEHIRQRWSEEHYPRETPGCSERCHSQSDVPSFSEKPYRQRNKIESVFSAVKRKLSSRAPGRSLTTQIRQALLLGLAYNIYRLRHRFAHRGCQQSPTLARESVSVASKGLKEDGARR